MYRGLTRIEIYSALAIGVLTGVYIFQPAAIEAGQALRAQQSQQQQQPAPPPQQPPPRKTWRD